MKRKASFQESKQEISGSIKVARPSPGINTASKSQQLMRHLAVYIQHMATGDFDKIKKYFSRFTEESVRYFFEQKGLDILRLEFNIKNADMSRLNFIFNNIPHESIRKILGQKDFQMLKSFLDITYRIEELGLDNEEIRKIRIAKFEFINHFLGRDRVEGILLSRNIGSQKIKIDFGMAQDIYTASIDNLNDKSSQSGDTDNKKHKY